MIFLLFPGFFLGYLEFKKSRILPRIFQNRLAPFPGLAIDAIRNGDPQ